MKKILLLLFPLGLFAQQSTWSETTSKLKYANTIVVEDLQKHITILASLLGCLSHELSLQ